MSNIKRQIKTDVSIESILEVNVVQAFEKDQENVPSDEERALGAEGAISTQRIHVNDQGFLTTKKFAP
jgi:hypothetical protein